MAHQFESPSHQPPHEAPPSLYQPSPRRDQQPGGKIGPAAWIFIALVVLFVGYLILVGLPR